MSRLQVFNGIKIPKKDLIDYCKSHHIKKLAFFGSFLSDSFRQDSDIDLLVEFEEEYVPGFFRLFQMEEELSSFFRGHKVDLRTPNDLSRYFRKDYYYGDD